MRVVQKKVCMLGSFAVGKTSLVRRFVEGRFDDKYLSTIGVKISRKTISNHDSALNLIIWDLAGGDEFLRSNTSYLRGAVGALIVCDVTRPQTLTVAQSYVTQLRSINPEAQIVLVANKADLADDRMISDADMENVCADIRDCYWLLTSAKTSQNVEEAFIKLAGLVSS